MAFTLQQAGTAVGLSKTSILRAIKRGTISAVRDPLTNNWAIDPAELHRVFPPVTEQVTLGGAPRDAEVPAVLRAELVAERGKVALLEETVADLRRRLDTAEEERRRVAAVADEERRRADEERQRLTAILTDQRAAPAPIRRWWPWRR